MTQMSKLHFKATVDASLSPLLSSIKIDPSVCVLESISRSSALTQHLKRNTHKDSSPIYERVFICQSLQILAYNAPGV